MNLYNQKILDHFYHPRNAGEFDEGEPNVKTKMIGNASTDFMVVIQIQVKANQVSAVHFKASGDPCIIACASYATEWLLGKKINQLSALKSQDFIDVLELPDLQKHYATLITELVHQLV